MNKNTTETPELLADELKPWPFKGYAPGRYFIKCADCGGQKTDCDKRASRCLECAILLCKRQEASHSPASGELADRLETLHKDATQSHLSILGEPAWAIYEGRKANAARNLRNLLVESLPTILTALRSNAVQDEARSSAEFQQRRGMLGDSIAGALLEYREFMKDDDYDAHACLDRMVKHLERAEPCIDAVQDMPASVEAFAQSIASEGPRILRGIHRDELCAMIVEFLRTQPVTKGGDTRCPNCHVRFSRIDSVDAHLAALSGRDAADVGEG